MANLESLAKTILEELREVTREKSVVGDPVELEKAKVIPLVKLGYGFGGVDLETKGHGQSGGGGVSMEPVGMLVAQDGNIRLENLSSNSNQQPTASTIVNIMESAVNWWLKTRNDDER